VPRSVQSRYCQYLESARGRAPGTEQPESSVPGSVGTTGNNRPTLENPTRGKEGNPAQGLMQTGRNNRRTKDTYFLGLPSIRSFFTAALGGLMAGKPPTG
jgi:hypothetical protein